jgi:hypothetical protein
MQFIAYVLWVWLVEVVGVWPHAAAAMLNLIFRPG